MIKGDTNKLRSKVQFKCLGVESNGGYKVGKVKVLLGPSKMDGKRGTGDKGGAG